MISIPSLKQSGFTLIEIIVILVMGSILGAMLVPFLGKSLSESGTPVIRLQSALATQQAMENITADYNIQVKDDTLDIASFKTGIGAAGSDQSNSYGSYHVKANEYVTIDAADPANYSLKVGISDTSGMTLYAVFIDQ